MPPFRTSAARAKAIKAGYRSGLENTVSKSLQARGCDFDYEQHTLRYDVPASTHKYTPDFVLPNGIVVETKGMWDAADRKKIALVKAQYPRLDLRMVFSNFKAKITKVSKTTYAMVCDKMGIPYAAKDIPTEWLNEPPNGASLSIIESLASK